MDEKIGYKCVFTNAECPVRNEFKLQPENLLKFCEICELKSPKKATTDYVLIANYMYQFIESMSKEKLALMDLVKALAEKVANQ